MGMGGMGGSMAGFGGLGGGLPGMGGMGGDMGMGMGMGMGGEAGMGMGMGMDPSMQQQMSPYRLFRFFDFTVQDGKRYVYRIKLKLVNPNYGLEKRFVVDQKTVTEKLIDGPWSEPTAIVTVNRSSRLLAGKVEPPRGTREAKATIILRHFDPNDGATFKEFPLELGQIANFPAQKQVDHFDWKTYSNQPVTSVDFTTDMMLVDLRGGEQLDTDKEFSEPGEMLFMSPDGSLIVKTELDDWDRYSNDQQTLEVLKNPNPNGMGMGGEAGGMMPGMMPGGEAGGMMPGGGPGGRRQPPRRGAGP
jgi:hypothetical protein